MCVSVCVCSRTRSGPTHMSYHDNPVLGQVNVRLDGVGADLDGPAEGPHRVLGEAGLVAPVSHGLREAVVDPRLGPSPVCCCREFSSAIMLSGLTLEEELSSFTGWDSVFVRVRVHVRVCVLRHHPLAKGRMCVPCFTHTVPWVL